MAVYFGHSRLFSAILGTLDGSKVAGERQGKGRKVRVRKTNELGPKTWVADLGKINGRRVRKFFETKAQAEKYLELKKKERDNLGIQALTLSHEERSEYLAVKEKLKPFGVSLIEVVDFYIANGVRSKPCAIAKAIAECLLAKETSGRRKRYLHELRCSLKSFTLGREEKLCSEVTPQDVDAWLNGQGWRMTTRAGYLTNLRTFFNFARSRNYCMRNPAEAIEKPMPEVTIPKVLSVTEIRALLRTGLTTDPELTGGFIAPILFGGMRTVESSRTSTADVRAEVIRVLPDKAKTRQRRDIERSELLSAWLAYCAAWPIINIRRRLVALRKAAARELYGADSHEAFPWPSNCLRHSFCSYALPIIGARQTAEAAGHSEEVLFNRYREVVEKNDAEEFWILFPEEVFRTKVGEQWLSGPLLPPQTLTRSDLR